jgi:hypothetical protein
MAAFRGLLRTLVSTLALTRVGSSVQISAPATPPSDASEPVSPSFQSWAFAVHSWPDYAGSRDQPNEFTKSLIGIIANKTGSAPSIRVGGTSGDRTTFVANQTEAIIYDPIPGSLIPGNVTIGPTFYDSFETLSEFGAQYIYMVNLASLDLQNALAEARHALNAIGGNLEAIEIGNEPDLYISQGVRPSSWTEADYVQEWHSFAGPISEQVLNNNSNGIDSSVIYQALAFSSVDAGSGFTIEQAFDDGIDAGNNVKSVSAHHYMTTYSPATTLQASLMNHTAIVRNVSAWLSWKDYLAGAYPTVPLYLGEANSNVPSNSNPTTVALQAVFGSALWKVDILMYAISQSIARYYVQQGTGFAFDSWQPVDSNGINTQILPSWYGDVFIADIIGTGSNVQVSNIDLGDDLLSAYAVYADGSLSKYVVVNLEEWNTTTAYARPATHISLSIPDNSTQVQVGKLTAPGAESTSGISWAGQSWQFSASSPGQVDQSGSLDLSPASSKDGVVSLQIQASEALVVDLGSTWSGKGAQ